jgi:hypothetical protein
MKKGHDDLKAVRLIAEVLQPFSDPERERVLRWVRERLGMTGTWVPPATPETPQIQAPPAPAGRVRDIRTFIQEKQPKNERHLAAVVAYYHQLEAPQHQRKESVGSQDLLDACRAANWPRPKDASQSLINAFNAGYIDKAGERGKYRLNAVGENLVAMVLPQGQTKGAATPRPAKKRTGKKRTAPKRR